VSCEDVIENYVLVIFNLF